METIFTAINFFLGIITVFLSVVVAILFARRAVRFRPNSRNKEFSWALSLQLVGESVIGFGTLVFATAAHFGWLDDWSTSLQSLIRFVMFLATSITTVHLYKTIKRIQDA